MKFEQLKRRSYLGGVAGAITGLAGCGGEAPNTKTDVATETATTTTEQVSTPESEATAETTTESLDSIPQHDHSGEQSGGAVLNPTEFSATEFTQSPSYLIYNRDEQVRALNCRKEKEQFSSSEATDVFESVINALSAALFN